MTSKNNVEAKLREGKAQISRGGHILELSFVVGGGCVVLWGSTWESVRKVLML